ncbi:MAG: hypothetical protein K9M57_04790 [Phycisphaerae bacterium]|nr:hypothetical protein [Phycisphaerae bacterium]
MLQVAQQSAKEKVDCYFDHLNQKVLTKTDLDGILRQNRSAWEIPRATTTLDFIQSLITDGKIQSEFFDFPTRKFVRYTRDNPSISEVILSLKPGCHFSHHTAMYLHELTNSPPPAIYVNFEQNPKNQPPLTLRQESINVAFGRNPRVTTNIAEYQNQKIYLLNGMHTDNLGVISCQGPADELIRVTCPERTLIDITVRPAYSGGPAEVLNAFRLARGKFSVTKLADMLKTMTHSYPYHQAIGFYLQRTGVYAPAILKPLREFPIKFDFYLTHQIQNPSYDPNWRIYYPAEL